jgi:hypothetical protein
MTYMFEIRHEHVQEGEAAEKELARLKGVRIPFSPVLAFCLGLELVLIPII